ncbi:MAG: hypothetical protein M3119_06165 [Verrucomicrobiota bacterium]|nr:hypothetical protein [Verrucomicrobiota bacterium]
MNFRHQLVDLVAENVSPVFAGSFLAAGGRSGRRFRFARLTYVHQRALELFLLSNAQSFARLPARRPYAAVALVFFLLLLLKVDRIAACILLPYLIYLLYRYFWGYRVWQLNRANE